MSRSSEWILEIMSKRLITTAAIGHLPWLEYTRPYMLEYASQTGADFQEIKWFAEFEEYGECNYFIMVEILKRFGQQDYYDELLFLDADVLVLPGSPNIFKEFDSIGMADDWYIPTQEGHFENWLKENKGDKIGYNPENIYYNSGVIAVKHEVTKKISYEGPYPNRPWYDQDWLNDQLNRLEIKVDHLDRAWNYRELGEPEVALREGFFLHFCGEAREKGRVKEYVKLLED